MPGVLFEDELKELLAKCENIVPEENYVVDECTKERDKEFELAKKSGVDLLSAYVTLSKDNKLSKNAIYTMLEDNDIEYGLIDENIELLAEKGSEAGGVYAEYAAATTRNMTEADIPMA